jgi:hypothetical protein
VTVTDTELPAITCPSNVGVNVAPGTCAVTVTYTAPVGTDNCAGQATAQTAGLASGASFPSGVTTNTFRVTDAAGNTATCAFTVTVTDNELPAITCPSNVSTNAAPGACTATVTYTAPVGTDNCAGQTTVQTAGLASGASFPGGVTTNTFRITDAAGNTATCSFTVTVTDNELPTITCPSNTSVSASLGSCAATVTYATPVGADNCAGQTTAQTAGLASGASFPVGTTTNTFWVTDAAGNTATCSFTVTVTDNEVPAITCPSNTSVGVSTGLCSAVVTYATPTGTDNCPGAATTLTGGLASGSTFPLGTTTNTFRVTDAAGNTTTCSFTVTVTDTELPAITCPSNVGVNVAPGTCAATVTYTAPVGTDNCAGQATAQTAGLASGASFPSGVTTNTFRVTDAAGNTATCSFTVTVTDNELPAITCPSNVSTTAAPGTCTATVTYTAPVGTDNCAGQTTAQTAGLASGASFPGGVTTNTFRVTDAAGNTATCSFTVTVTDNELPTITCPSNTSVSASLGSCAATVTYATPVGADNCAGQTTAQTAGLASGGSFPVGVTTNTFRVTDAAGNTATCSFTVTVTDNEAPAITCPGPQTLVLDAACEALLPDYTTLGTTSDNCPGTPAVTQSPIAGTLQSGVGAVTIMLTATDVSLNTSSCSFTVNKVDNMVPTITCPSNISVNATLGSCDAVVSYATPTGSDNCTGASTALTAGLASGAAFPTGTTTNTFQVTDGSGNTASCSFTVTVTDNQPPTITCPANISVNATTGQCNAVVTYAAPVGTDNCAGASTSQTTGLASGASFPVGVTTNTFTVTDASSNTATCSFTVTVSDAEAPTITCPANMSVSATTGQCAAVVTYVAPVGSDNCPSPTTAQTAGLASGSSFPVGVTTNVFLVTDAASNTATCSFTVTVTDNEVPTITCPANMSVSATVGQCAAVVTYVAPVGADNCTGATTVQTAGLASGASFPVGVTTNSFLVTDAVSNTATCSFTVTVTDNQAPTITCPSNSSVNATSGQCDATVTYTAPVGSDNCPGPVTTQSAGLASGALFPVGVTTNTFLVTDAASNTATCSFTVTVVDNQLPTITCPSNITVNSSPGLCSAAVTYSVSSTDNCSGQVVTQTLGLASGANFPVGLTNNTFRVTDGGGNTATCTFTVTVNDVEAPTAICQGVTTYLDVNGTTTIFPGDVNNGSSDACGIVNMTLSTSTFNCSTAGTNTVVLTVTDLSGNTGTCSATVTVADTIVPTITCPANISVTADSSLCGAFVTWAAPSSNDNCLIQSIVGTHTSGTVFPTGNTTVSYTVTDANGNTGTCSFVVSVTPVTLGLDVTSALLGCGYHLVCATDSNATATAEVMGGCMPYQYLWSTSATTASINNLAPGMYYVTVTDAQNETRIDSIMITAPAPMVLTLTGDTLVCDGLTTGQLAVAVTGGHDCAAYSYLWSNSATTSALTSIAAGTYTVTVTDTVGCSASIGRTLVTGVNPVLTLGPDTLACPGGSVLFEAPPIYDAYLWNDGSNNSTILMTQPGLYHCTVWTAEGCTDSDTVLFGEYVVDMDIITPLGALDICDGDTLTLQGDAGLTDYNWSTGDTTSTISVFGTGGTFTLSATDIHGCTASDTITVNYTPFTDPLPVITPGPNAALCDGGSLQLDVQAGYFSYNWSTGGNTSAITVTSPGVYQVTVANGFGCTRTSDPVTVSVVPNPTPTVTLSSGVLSTGSYAGYQWLLGGSPVIGQILQTFTPTVAGWYSVTVTDSNGCTGTSDPVYFNPVGMEEETQALHGLSLYPNPTRDVLTLQTLHPIDWPVEVEIWDMFGHRVKAVKMAHLMDLAAFDVSDIASAPYLMKITTFRRNETQQVVLRFVKE